MSEHEPLRPLSDSQREVLEEATATYQGAVTRAVAHWLRARGIDREVAATFRLGVVADPFPGHERHRGKLAIPYLGHDGRVLTIRFRCLEEHDHRTHFHGKYMSLAEDTPRLFHIKAIHQAADTIHIAEGEFDAMVLNKLGLPAIAIPGVQLWRGSHRRALAGFQRIWVWGDPDDAGADMVSRITKQLPRAKGVRLRTGDVTETYLAGGADALLALIEEEKK